MCSSLRCIDQIAEGDRNILEWAATEYQNQIAIVSIGESLSFSDLLKLAEIKAEKLRKFGLAETKRVAISLENPLPFIETICALWCVGAIPVLLNWRWPRKKLESMARDLGCVGVLSASGYTPINSDATSLDAKSIANIMLTSGSTGRPRAIVHSFLNHLYNALGASQVYQYQVGNRWLLSLPLFHVGGLAILFRSLVFGGTCVIPDSNLTLSENIKKHSISHLSLVPTQLRRLLSENLAEVSSLQTILVGGASCPRNLIRAGLAKGLPLFTTYGSSELSSQVATIKVGSDLSELNQLEVLPYRQVTLSPDGEILLRGETLAVGTLENEKIVPLCDQEGWYHSGDLGELSEEKFLKVIGRKDNMFISGGENIYPETIESALLEIEGVIEAIVVPIKDEEFGERPVAFVKGLESFDKEQLDRELERRLPRFMIPVNYIEMPEYQGLKPSRISLKEFAAMQCRA